MEEEIRNKGVRGGWEKAPSAENALFAEKEKWIEKATAERLFENRRKLLLTSPEKGRTRSQSRIKVKKKKRE